MEQNKLNDNKLNTKLVNQKKLVKIAVIGAAGYTGFELLKILNRHKFANIVLVTSNQNESKLISEVFPSLLDFKNNQKFLSTESKSFPINILLKSNVVFLCLPPFESMNFIKNYLLDYSGLIIDIGSDFRLKDYKDYKYWYQNDHILKDSLKDFVYGIPELYFKDIKGSKKISNPGCYPTSVILALAPIIKENKLFEIIDINIDAKSGVSGAGKKLKEMYLFCSVNENFLAYSPLMHRHIGEIEQEIKRISGKSYKVSFTPHLLPINRGIFSTIYCKIKFLEAVEAKKTITTSEEYLNTDKNVLELKNYIDLQFKSFYKNSNFVRFLGEEIPQIKDVVNTNYCYIGYSFDIRTNILKIFSVIDNLLKGASGQAVQNMNIALGLTEHEGLII